MGTSFRLRHEEEGQVVLEYALLLFLFAGAAGAGLHALSGAIERAFSDESTCIVSSPRAGESGLSAHENLGTIGPTFHTDFSDANENVAATVKRPATTMHNRNGISPR